MARVLLYSDEPVLARGLSAVLSAVDSLDLVNTCHSTTKLMEQLEVERPDLLLMDLTSEVTFTVLSDLRRAMTSCKVVLWVHEISTELAFQAMGLGVRGILRKTLPSELLVKCLIKVNEGELWFEKALTDSFLSAKRISLTKREGQLVTLLAQGLKNKEIASVLLISEGTVKVYLSRLFQKLGVKDRFELALYGLKNLTTGQLSVDRNARSADRMVAPATGLRSLVLERTAPPTPPIAPVPSRYPGYRNTH
jgi:DNA-binding NarL/FixJ family response regulator